MATVTLQNVSKIYKGGVGAVLSATLDIRDGEFIVLVGPSGCGKSTLLRMIAGLEEITEGDIFIGNRRVNDVSPRDRNVAMVFQNYALYPHMSVAQNLGFGLKLRKYSKAEIEEQVQVAAEILGIEDILRRKPSDLSGGQRQRVAVGRAIVRKPDVFLFDEPLSNLDARLRVQMRMEITRLHRQLGTTMIYVTHDQIEAMTMGDRIVVLDKGVVQQVESPLSLYNNPANRFVATFIGSPGMNLFPGRLRLEEALVFDAEDSALSCSLSHRNFDWLKAFAGRHIQLGIRPEHIRQSVPSGPEFGIIRADFRLDIVEPMGNEVVIYARRHGNSVVARFAPESLPNPGYELSLRMDVSEAHFFDADSGVNLKWIYDD